MEVKTRNQLALVTLLVAKLAGIAGLMVGVTAHRIVGGTLLALDGVLLVVSFVLCLLAMRDQRREEVTQKELLAKMVREGTLEQFLRDVRVMQSEA